MAKHITNEEFFNQLNSCEYGRQYIELVNNPKNHLGKKEEGENHHIYMKAICGENSHLVRLSYFNHCLVHLLLAKAGCELDAWWSGKALNVINRMDGKNQQYNSLTDLEKAELELEGWAEAKRLASIKNSDFQKERYKDPKEREKASKGQIERYKDPKERKKMSKIIKEAMNRPEVKEKASKGQIERYKDPKEREKTSKGQIKRYKDPKAREKTGKAMKGKNVGRIKIINENEPKYKMIFPKDLPYWESLGWYKKSA